MKAAILVLGALLLVACEGRRLGPDFSEVGQVDVMSLDDLEAKKARADQAKAELAKIEVMHARFYGQTIGPATFPRYEFALRNGTNHALSKVDFVARLVSPGRSVPWEEKSISYDIRGGLEPGEERQWDHLIDWHGPTPADVVLKIAIERAYGADGLELFPEASAFTGRDAEELDKNLQGAGGHARRTGRVAPAPNEIDRTHLLAPTVSMFRDSWIPGTDGPSGG